MSDKDSVVSDSEIVAFGNLIKTEKFRNVGSESDLSSKESSDNSEEDAPTKSKKFKYDDCDDSDEEKAWKVSEKEQQLANLLFGDRDTLIKNLGDVSTKQTENDNKEIESKVRNPVWHDSDDDSISDKFNTKKEHLEKKFDKIVGKPIWADLDRKDEPNSDDEINQTVGHLKTVGSQKVLRKGVLQIKYLKDLNRASYREGPRVNAIEFHPSSMIALVAGYNGVASLFSIDGQKNDKLHSMLFKNFRLHTAKFNRQGEEIIFGGIEKHIYTFDLLTATTDRIFLPKNFKSTLRQFTLSSCEKYIAAGEKLGHIHILHPRTKELLASYKQEYETTAIAFSPDSTKIFSHSDNNEITVYDIRANKISHKLYDDGCLNGSSIDISPNSQFFVSGNQQGVVNIYQYQDILKSKTPEPLKRIFNLTTGITCTKFHPSSEILAICSNEVENAVKLIHFPTMTTFMNFPDQESRLGNPNLVNFSKGGKYFAVGNLQKKVSLFSLKHFVNY